MLRYVYYMVYIVIFRLFIEEKRGNKIKVMGILFVNFVLLVCFVFFKFFMLKLVVRNKIRCIEVIYIFS